MPPGYTLSSCTPHCVARPPAAASALAEKRRNLVSKFNFQTLRSDLSVLFSSLFSHYSSYYVVITGFPLVVVPTRLRASEGEPLSPKRQQWEKSLSDVSRPSIAGMLEVRMDWLLKRGHQPRNIPIMRRFLWDVDAANPQDARGCSALASAMSNPNSVRSDHVRMFPTMPSSQIPVKSTKNTTERSTTNNHRKAF